MKQQIKRQEKHIKIIKIEIIIIVLFLILKL